MTAGADRTAPSRDELDRLLRACVECGLCLPHCATYLASGDETLSPRGRFVLLGEVVNGRLAAGAPGVVRSFDLCLGCLACTAVCPSGVSVDLLDQLQALGAASRRPAWSDLTRWLDRAAVLHALRRGGRIARRILAATFGDLGGRRLERGPAGLARLARLVGTLPAAPATDQALIALLDGLVAVRARPPASPAPATPALQPGGPARGPRVIWFRGCADRALLPATARRLRELLRELGCEVREPSGQECCGALAAHAGRAARARRLRPSHLAAFAPDAAGGAEPLVVAAAGCGCELKRYPPDLAARVTDAVVLLDRLAPSAFGAVPLRVAVHDPCHARHGQGIVVEPRRLLRRIPGLELCEPAEAEACCGSAGIYGLRHPELSAAMGRRKAEVLAATGCDLVVTANPGCLGQIADGLALVAPAVPVVPLSDLVWYSCYRGRGARART